MAERFFNLINGPLALPKNTGRSVMFSSIMPRKIERDDDHCQKKTITNHTSYNAPPTFTQSGLPPLRQEGLLRLVLLQEIVERLFDQFI